MDSLAAPPKPLPLAYPLVLVGVLAVVTAGQWVEDALDSPQFEMLTPAISIPRWTIVVLTLYMLLMLRLIQGTAAQTLRAVRSSVEVDDKTYAGFRRRMERVNWRADAFLGVIAVLFVVLLFPILRSPLPVVRNPVTNEFTYLPQEPLNALVVLAAYILVGWAALSLTVNTIQLGYALGDLTQKPLRINVFDTDNVVPLGRLALVLSMAPAGIVVILLAGLGTPTGPLSWFSFLLASVASVLALVLPLRGVHRQMDASKKGALAELNHELSEIHQEMASPTPPDPPRTAHLSNRTSTLVNLRKVVQEGPTWPFQSTVAVSRALLVASAPLIYTFLNELIRIFFIAPLTR
jgi:hypothetical protein